MSKQWWFNGIGAVAVFGLTALFGTTAQAGVFLENGTAITTSLTGTGEVDTLGRFEIPALNVEIDCTTFIPLEGVLLGSGAGEEPGVGHGQALAETCKAYVITPVLTEQTGCKIYPTAADRTAGTNLGKILVQGLGEVILHGETPYIRVKGIGAEETFSQIFTQGCIGLPNGTKVKGSGTLKVTPGKENAVKQLAEMADLTLFPNKLRFGVNESLVLGSAWGKLSNENPGGMD
jgi:hypothetical protein